MECGSCGEKSKASKYVCAKCGKEEIRAAKEGRRGKELLRAGYGRKGKVS